MASWWNVVKNVKNNPGLAYRNAASRFSEGQQAATYSDSINPFKSSGVLRGAVNALNPFSIQQARAAEPQAPYSIGGFDQDVSGVQFGKTALTGGASASKTSKTTKKSSKSYSGYPSINTAITAPQLTDIYTPDYKWWMGKRYDVNNDDERRAYYNDQYTFNLGEGQKQYDDAMSSLKDDRTNLTNNRSDWMTDWTKQVGDLSKNYQGRLAGIGNYYSGLGDIYQSSQGVRETDATNTYNTANEKANREKDRATTNFDQTEQDLKKEETNYGDWWRKYQTNLADQRDSQNFAAEQAKLEKTRTAYSPIEKMTAIASDVSALGLPVGSSAYRDAIARAGQRLGVQVGDTSAAGTAAQVVNKYYTLVDKTGDPSSALASLTSAERQILSQYGI